MLSNSLFLDFLQDNGLEVWKGESTRDIVGLTFSYGSRSYDQERKHLEKLLKAAESNEWREKILALLDLAAANKDKYDKKSKQEILRTTPIIRRGILLNRKRGIIRCCIALRAKLKGVR